MYPENQPARERRTERAENGARVTFGEPTDVRLAVIHQALDRLTALHLPTLTARLALLDLADDLGPERAHHHRPERAD